MARPPLRTHQKALILAVAISIVCWVVPVMAVVDLPLQFLDVHLHEFCHALMASITGGEVSHITIFPEGGGVTDISGGNTILTGSAGYIGSTIIGGFIVLGGKTEQGARRTLYALMGTLALSLFVWVRQPSIGPISGFAWVVALALAAALIKGSALQFVCQFIGVQLCLTSFQSFFVLLQISAFTHEHSDALILQQATGLPALVWALLWSGLSVVALYFTVAAAWRPSPTKTRPAGPSGL